MTNYERELLIKARDEAQFKANDFLNNSWQQMLYWEGEVKVLNEKLEESK